MGKNSHFGVTSQNIFSQSQKYFDTTFIYFLQFSSKLEMLISFKWKVRLRKFLQFSKGYTLKIISQDFFSCWNSFLLKWHSLAHSALSGPPTLMISIVMKVSLIIKKLIKHLIRRRFSLLPKLTLWYMFVSLEKFIAGRILGFCELNIGKQQRININDSKESYLWSHCIAFTSIWITVGSTKNATI